MRISALARYGSIVALGALLAGCSSISSGSQVPPLATSAASQSVPDQSGDQKVGAPGLTLVRSSVIDMPLTQESVVYTFRGGSDGGSPYAGLLFANNKFYGTTFDGGTGPSGGDGTVFTVSSSGTEKVLYSFQYGTDGAAPQAGVIAGEGGVLYGDTVYGGGATTCTIGCGTVFELAPKGSGYSERVLYAFQGGSDGAYPVGTLLRDKSGALYGTTVHGGSATVCAMASGAGGCGTVFKLTPSGSGYTEKVVYSFQGGSDGALPSDALIADATGALYGTTQWGGGATACASPSGMAGCGTVFKLTPSGTGYTEKVLYRFKGGTNDGQTPRGALLAGKNGSLIGATTRGGPGGASGSGTIFELKRSGLRYTERVVYFFPNCSTCQHCCEAGAVPEDEHGLYADKSGDLYGTTIAGGKAVCGSNPCGTVFRLTPSRTGYTETVLHKFQGGKDGADPRGSVVADESGTLYGTTFGGASSKCTNGCGVVFKVSP